MARQNKRPPVPAVPSALTFATSDITVVSQHTPTEYERTTYYNGTAGDGDHPILIYRSDFFTTPFPKPSGRYGQIPVKTLRGVYDTQLNVVWETVGPGIVDLITTRRINWSSVDPARFFTHATAGEEEKGSLGPVVIWVGVMPGSTSSDTAHKVSQEILALLQAHGVKDAVVEWREAVLQRLVGPPLMRHVGSTNPTHHARRFLTALLGIPLATQEMEKDSQGTLTLWLHETRDGNGEISPNIYGVSCCHVLREDTTRDYEHDGAAPKHLVRVCGARRFQRGLTEIERNISACGIRAGFWTREVARLEVREQDEEVAREIGANRRNLADETEATQQLEALHEEITEQWANIKRDRDIGYVQHAEAIKVDVAGGTRYTSDWGAFLATEAKVRPCFEGNVVDLGAF